MKDVIIIDKFPRFSNILEDYIDRALGELSSDILRAARPKTPYSGTVAMREAAGRTERRGTGGHLRMDSYPEKVGRLKWQVVYNKEYASAQEAGTDGQVIYTRYTTPGTGKAYLSTAGKEQSQKALNILRKHMGRARV